MKTLFALIWALFACTNVDGARIRHSPQNQSPPAAFLLHSNAEPEFVWALVPNPKFSKTQNQGMERSGRFLDAHSPNSDQKLIATSEEENEKDDKNSHSLKKESLNYNSKYPLTRPSLKFRFGVIADLDKKSKLDGGREYEAFLKEGFLKVEEDSIDQFKIQVEWKPESETHIIKSGFNYGGRGLELSTLNIFNGKIYSCGDKTGIVFELLINQSSVNVTPVPWAILSNVGGSPSSPTGQGFKCEWATVKGEHLWIGGHGTGGSGSGHKYLKIVSPSGQVRNVDWSQNYAKLAAAVKISAPGYITNEAAAWSDMLKKWIFAPRKISKDAFNEEKDESAGSNIVLIADENFNEIQIVVVGDLIPTHGFSSIKFIPGTDDEILVGIKSVEAANVTESYIMAFDLKGKVLLNETLFAEEKYEGVEFF